MTPFTDAQVDALLQCYVAGLTGGQIPARGWRNDGGLTRAELVAVGVGHRDRDHGLDAPVRRTVGELVTEVRELLREEPAEDDATAAHLDGLACGARDVLDALEKWAEATSPDDPKGPRYVYVAVLEGWIASERAKLPAPPKTYREGVEDALANVLAWYQTDTDKRRPDVLVAETRRALLGEEAGK